MESTLQKPALVAAKTTPKAKTIVYWIVTALFCLQMSFTAYAQLRLPQVAEAFAHLSVGDGPEAWGWAAATGVLWGLSYFFWRRLQATPALRTACRSEAMSATLQALPAVALRTAIEPEEASTCGGCRLR